ncbi:MAG: HIT family protein [Patescibacteria group bacterium]|nr:HIT family protein [Patescibacteria group bacterium]
MSKDCIFCKIAAGEIPSHKIYEDDYVLAFLDIHPCSTGHAVVIPKKHFESIEEIDSENLAFLNDGARRTAKKVYSVLKPDGMNIGLNDKPAAGQAVPHIHLHIIPRWKGDGGGSMHSIVRAEATEPAEEIIKKFV